MQTFEKIVGFILSAFTLLTLYKTVYMVLGFLGKRLNNPTRPLSKIELERRYGVVICARNEETVISSLIDSICLYVRTIARTKRRKFVGHSVAPYMNGRIKRGQERVMPYNTFSTAYKEISAFPPLTVFSFLTRITY